MSDLRLNLDNKQFARLRGQPGRRVRVTCGSVWLTIDGRIDDHILRRGDTIELPQRASVLVQALDAPARLVVHDAATTRSRVRGALARLLVPWRARQAMALRWSVLR